METKFTEEQIIAAMRGIVYTCAKTLAELTPEQRFEYAPLMMSENSKDREIKVFCLFNYRLISPEIIRLLLKSYNQNCFDGYLKLTQKRPFLSNSHLDKTIEIVIGDGNMAAFRNILENCRLTVEQEWKILTSHSLRTDLSEERFVEEYFSNRALWPKNLKKLCRSPYDSYYRLYRKYYEIPQKLRIIHFLYLVKKIFGKYSQDLM